MAKNVVDEIHMRCQHTKLWYDRTAKAFPEPVTGQGVCMQPLKMGGQWRRATVTKKVIEHSYLTQIAEGQVYRRNRDYLQVNSEEPSSIPGPTSGDTILSPGSIETKSNENSMSSGEVQTKNTEQFTDDTPSAEYKITCSSCCLKLPTRYHDYTNTYT